jgi:UDP-N-acetylmuramyl pentapeptide synthase
MGEVGTQGPTFHAEVGAYARERGIEQVWAVGTLCAHAGAHRHFPDTAALKSALSTPEAVPAAASVLIKGSRFMQMDRVVEPVVQALRQAAGGARGGAHAA